MNDINAVINMSNETYKTWPAWKQKIGSGIIQSLFSRDQHSELDTENTEGVVPEQNQELVLVGR